MDPVLALCTASLTELRMSVEGGSEPYIWTLVQAPPGLTLMSPSGSRVSVSGTPTTPGEYSLVVDARDASGDSARLAVPVNVHEAPAVSTSSLATACPGQAYSQVLSAAGGDPDDYRWSTDFPEAEGLRLEGDTLLGTIEPGASSPRNIPFEIQVEDPFCASDSVPVTLHVAEAGTLSCPEIRVEGMPANLLPSACRDNRYRAEFVIRGGSEPYTWRTLSLPAGLAFDAEHQVLSGKPSEAGEVVLEVTDHANRRVQQSFPLAARDTCWFAYISNETGAQRLHLVDPILQRFLDTQQSFPSELSAGAVLDFKFSSNGRALAYRVQTSSAPKLTVLRAPNWHEEALNLGAAVTDYAWSPGGATLAVALSRDGQAYLSGVDFASSPVEFPATLIAGASQSLWFDAAHLAFLTPSAEPAFSNLAFVTLSDGRFLQPASREEFYDEASTTFTSATGGVMVEDAGTGAIDFHPLLEGGSSVTHYEARLAPSGAYLGRARKSQLQLFRPGESSAFDEPSIRAEGCDTLIGWAKGRERIACTSASDGNNQIVVFDVQSTGQVRKLSDIRGDYALPVGAETQRRRIFSATGNKFAFQTEDALFHAALDAGTPVAVGVSESADPDPSRNGAMIFSPDERWLLRQRGTHLLLYGTRDDDPSLLQLRDDLPLAVPCVESATDLVGDWCGSQTPPGGFAWSPNSDSLFFQSADGTLKFIDFDPRTFTVVPLDAACGEGCIQHPWLKFQPPE